MLCIQTNTAATRSEEELELEKKYPFKWLLGISLIYSKNKFSDNTIKKMRPTLQVAQAALEQNTTGSPR